MDHTQVSFDPFEGARSRAHDPETSHESAGKLSANRLEAIVLEGIKRLNGATSEELAVALKIDRVTVSPRLRPLERKGLIADSNKRRIGSSGRSSIVWVIPAEESAPRLDA